MSLAIPFAFDSNKYVVFVENAIKGECYTCAECNQDIVFCDGEERTYFRHKAKTTCKGTGESAEHQVAKKLICQYLHLWNIIDTCERCRREENLKACFHSSTAKEEVYICDNKYKADVLVTHSDQKQSVVEIYHTHAVDRDKFIGLKLTFGKRIYEFMAKEVIESYENRSYHLLNNLHFTCKQCENMITNLSTNINQFKLSTQCNMCKRFKKLNLEPKDISYKDRLYYITTENKVYKFQCFDINAGIATDRQVCDKCIEKINGLLNKQWTVRLFCSRDKCNGFDSEEVQPKLCGELIIVGNYYFSDVNDIDIDGDMIKVKRSGYCEDCQLAKRLRPCKYCKKWIDMYDMERVKYGNYVCRMCFPLEGKKHQAEEPARDEIISCKRIPFEEPVRDEIIYRKRIPFEEHPSYIKLTHHKHENKVTPYTLPQFRKYKV